MTRLTAAATILLGILFAPASRADATLDALDAANKAFAQDLMAGNLDALVDAYTDDGCVIAPKAGEICGKEGIRAFWESVIATKPKAVEIITEKGGGEGDMAFATGQLVVTDAESAVHKSRFAVVFLKVEGAWKLRVDSWNDQ